LLATEHVGMSSIRSRIISLTLCLRGCRDIEVRKKADRKRRREAEDAAAERKAQEEQRKKHKAAVLERDSEKLKPAEGEGADGVEMPKEVEAATSGPPVLCEVVTAAAPVAPAPAEATSAAEQDIAMGDAEAGADVEGVPVAEEGAEVAGEVSCAVEVQGQVVEAGTAEVEKAGGNDGEDGADAQGEAADTSAAAGVPPKKGAKAPRVCCCSLVLHCTACCCGAHCSACTYVLAAWPDASVRAMNQLAMLPSLLQSIHRPSQAVPSSLLQSIHHHQRAPCLSSVRLGMYAHI
jgi:hypothetical protein